MKCERCQKNEASYFYREVINGKETKAYLCAQCAGKAEKDNIPAFQDIFGGFMGNIFSTVPHKQTGIADTERCSLCGTDFATLAKNGKVGCPKCYESFASRLDPTVKRLHGEAVHKGRIPRKYSEKLSARREEEQLEEALRAAIEKEEYEQAAVIRDKLREIRASKGE